MLGDEKIFVTPRGGLVRLFGLPWGFTPNPWGSRQKEIFDRAHPLVNEIAPRSQQFWRFQTQNQGC